MHSDLDPFSAENKDDFYYLLFDVIVLLLVVFDIVNIGLNFDLGAWLQPLAGVASV